MKIVRAAAQPFISEGHAMSQQPADRIPPDARPRRQELPSCRLVLHYDPQHELMFVVRTIMELTRFCRAEATHQMWQAYHSGQSVLLTLHRERAEFLAERFAERGLRVTVE
jgi:ATP-dependent Clp protease adapter protein ClpS